MIDWKLSAAQPQFARIRSLPDEFVPKKLLILLLLMLGYSLGTQLGNMLVMIPVSTVIRHSGRSVQELAGTTGFFVLKLYLTLVSIAVTALICKGIEHRTLRTMGVTKHRCVTDYLLGTVLGFVMFSAVTGINYAAGAVQPGTATETERNIPLMIVIFIGWIIQGFSEEFTFRGFIMMSAGTYHKPWTAVVFSSLLFGAAHIGNSGVTVSGVANDAMFGVLTALFMLRTDSIWGPAALHTVWNWTQGSFFGLKVSGLETGMSILHFEPVDGLAWMNGGTFGPEGGLGTTIVQAAVILILLFAVPQRTSDYPAEPAGTAPEA